ncbi:MAG: tetratricopeptide repeat protein [Nitrospirae bacterium]|nr:tetratricopeptide repeat protein [Nitrospirota bacterium]
MKIRSWDERGSPPRIVVIVGLVVLTAFLYRGIGEYDFFIVDDSVYFSNPIIVSGLSLKTLGSAFTEIILGNWHPLTVISHALCFRLFGSNSGIHHYVNLILHIITAIVLFLSLSEATGEVYKSALVSFAFALHPLSVETVAWVAERKGVLSSMFFMLTILSYVRYTKNPSWVRYLLIFTFFIPGLMSKQMIVTIPAVFLIMDAWPLGRLTKRPGSGIYEKIPFFIISAIFILVAFYAQKVGGAISGTDAIPIKLRLVNSTIGYVTYVSKILLPRNLAYFYPYDFTPSVWLFLISAISLISVTMLAIILRKNKPWFTAGWLWFIVTLIPVAQIVQIARHLTADRYAYLPMTGIFIIIVWWGADILRGKPKTMITAAIVTIATLMYISSFQIKTWRNSITIFRQAISVTKDNYIVYKNISHFLFNNNKVPEALPFADKSLEINPYFSEGHSMKGLILTRLNHPVEAEECFNAALKIDPQNTEAYIGLSHLMIKNGRYDEAISLCGKAIGINGDMDYILHNNIGIAFMNKGMCGRAVEYFKQSLTLNPLFSLAQDNLRTCLSPR